MCATAAELYADDNDGQYPGSLAALTPRYLKSLPTCPAAGRDTYSRSFVCSGHAFTLCCAGCHHHNASLDAPDYPAYNSREGLVTPGAGK